MTSVPGMAEWAPLLKHGGSGGPTPVMGDYRRTAASFSWDAVGAELGLVPGGTLNIAGAALDRPATATPGKLALRFIDGAFATQDFTFDELRRAANRFANALAQLEPGRGTTVTTLLGRCPELFFTAFGALKCGAVFSPLFSAFGPEPIRSRLELSASSVLVTTARFYERKVAPIRAQLPSLRHVFVVRDDAETPLPPGTLDFAAVMDSVPDEFTTAPTLPDDDALLHFTSGTTGKPKGVVHAHRAVVAHYATAKLALDLHADDVYWCTADPGWVTGVSYGMIAPLACGVTTLVDREELDIERWYALLEQQRVSVWYTAPTALRMLMKAGLEPVRAHRYPSLRFIASVGEPLNPEAVMWGMEAFGLPVHDTWWQTETGAIMIANFAAEPVYPGSMGRSFPGVEAGLGARRPDGTVELLTEPDRIGEIVLRPGWPSMFKGYLHNEERYRESFADGWYFSGDQAKRDARGYYWFIGRTDDIIKSAGHLISPFEVECALNQHPAVMQAAVIGIPDLIVSQVVKAIVELKPGIAASPELRRDLIAHGRRLLGAAIAPRDIDFTPALPRTRSGKIMRRLLRARTLGLPEGDLSTLESGT